MPFGSPVVNLVENCLANRLSFNEYGIDLSAPHTGPDSIVDLHVAPFENGGGESLGAVDCPAALTGAPHRQAVDPSWCGTLGQCNVGNVGA